MGGDKYLAAVGLSDEQVAHLRLLLRRLPVALVNRWHWGTEDSADLVIINPDSYLGRIARDRAGTSGRRCAVVSAIEPLRKSELRLAPPFTAVAVAVALNEATDMASHQGGLTTQHSDDFQDIAAQFSALNDTNDAEPESLPGLEDLLDQVRDAQLFKRTPLEMKKDDTTQSPERVSSRSEARALLAPIGAETRARLADDREPRIAWPLSKFLEGTLLGGPSVLALRDVPELNLDPKNRVFYSPAKTLQELIDCCARPLVLAEWRPLTSADLQRVRERQKERPYSHLVWLSAWLSSENRLAAHLPPSSLFRLKERPNVDDGVPGHRGIVDELIIGGRVYDIAMRCSVDPGEVIDLVNAYDAIGLIDAQRPAPGTSTSFRAPNDPRQGQR